MELFTLPRAYFIDLSLPIQHRMSTKYLAYTLNDAKFSNLDAVIAQGTGFHSVISTMRTTKMKTKH